ncbi:hypothetical protein [Bradyrhizobium jicamae]|uniref:hypothetical protein n=1 Tax=Bradyrhizobium jicamae TaxID=280332 RepID=UPI001BAB0A19|nr:hypothetical protein [Bradyrhizobium jicamae]MBR0933237.1 hypothetical protein [Bradyrhizobium jicamae]
MTSSNALDWIVGLLVCWASLTAIVQPSNQPGLCYTPAATSHALPMPLIPTPADAEAVIRDMKLHD